jgi:putative aminopeptidase FrvX
MTQKIQSVLEIFTLPTAPFCETLIQNYVVATLTAQKVPHFLDSFGNIVVGAKSEAQYRKILKSRQTEPVRFFVAHMDHPGFRGLKWSAQGVLHAEWLGGGPVKGLAGARVDLASSVGLLAEGRIVKAKLKNKNREIHSLEIRVPSSLKKLQAKDLFGGLSFGKTAWCEGAFLRTRAADDIAGVYAILEMTRDYATWSAVEKSRFLACLTRAEEVGFVGVLAHFKCYMKSAKQNLLFISLEASKTLPGAELGKGPVLRLGDRSGVFEARSLRFLEYVAAKALKKSFQKRLMDGGTCEATVAMSYGMPTIGISVPLANYHNARPESGRPGPEGIHLNDLQGLVVLCRKLVSEKFQDLTKSRRLRLEALYLKPFEKFLHRVGN